MSNEELAASILKAVGGAGNVKEVFHCVTRLRFYLYDRSKADIPALKKIPGVLGVASQTEQLQIIIGSTVGDVCHAVQAKIGMAPEDNASSAGSFEDEVKQNKELAKEKFRVGGIFETISACILPMIPALAGTGILKGIVTIMTSYLGFDKADPLVVVMTMTADVVFYFMPFFVAWAAAKRFKTDTAMALACAGLMLYPTMTAGLAAGSEPLSLFGLPIPFVKYASGCIPMMLTVWVLKYVHGFIDKHMPSMLKLVFTPLLTMVIMTPITLGVTGPIASYLAQAIAAAFTWLFTVSPILAGAVIGGTRSLLVFTGMHLSLGAVILANIQQFGYDYILPVNTMGTMAIVGVCLGVWIKAKDKDVKEMGASTFVSSFLGITEPGIYGVLMVYRNALIADIIAGAVAGAWTAAWRCTTNAYVNSCILSLPVFMDEHFAQFCIGMAIAVILGCGLVLFMGVGEKQGASKEEVPAAEMAGAGTGQASDAADAILDVASPVTGSAKPLSACSDAAFASGVLGKGCVIEPAADEVIAPFDGTVMAIYPSRHAIGLMSSDGVECLIHLGIDTVNLKGAHFEQKVAQGDSVHAGDVLTVVDWAAIKAEGYSTETPVLVTNSADYRDVFAVVEEGDIKAGGRLISIIK